MSAQQPEALRLADFLWDWLGNNVEPADLEGACVSAAAELRRLHSVNAQLLEALQIEETIYLHEKMPVPEYISAAISATKDSNAA